MTVIASIVAVALIVAQGLAVMGLLRFVRSFGAYVESHRELMRALNYTHESNVAIHEASLRILRRLDDLHEAIRKESAA